LPISADELLAYVHRVLDWYHHVNRVASLPGAVDDVVSRDRLQNQALTVVRLAIELGKAAAPLVGKGSAAIPRSGGGTSVLVKLQEATSNLGEREASLRMQIAALDRQIPRLRGEARKTLLLRRDSLTASLDLVHEGQASVHEMLQFASRAASTGAEGQDALVTELSDLERSIPQTPAPTGPAEAVAGAAIATTSMFRVESAGIIALVSQAVALRSTRGEMTSLSKETDALVTEFVRLHAAVASQTSEIMQGSIAATQEGVEATHKQEIEENAERFKALSSVVVPLSEQVLLLSNFHGTLDEWSNGVETRLLTVMRYFLLRLGVLLASVLVVLVGSEVWRRATLRYVHDPNRRRPLLVVRRLVVGLALVIVLTFGLASEVGSLATFVGFLTAGIAVTLQNVILSVVGYFFLIGRDGVQVGGRITLAGVTGRVVDISLLRLYLLELAGADLHSTGRLVVLSNAVLFQPAALYKQIPGADYLWHTLTLTIAPDTDIEEASRRLRATAMAVFSEYRGAIEQQHVLMQQHVDFETGLPQPRVKVAVADDGVRCSVRYPVPPEQAAAIDQQMLAALRAALDEDVPMRLLSTGAVKLAEDS
jgi:small-conductance mechanosensitive channel